VYWPQASLEILAAQRKVEGARLQARLDTELATAKMQIQADEELQRLAQEVRCPSTGDIDGWLGLCPELRAAWNGGGCVHMLSHVRGRLTHRFVSVLCACRV
jgi:hypothetical protein